jgi:branched-chain amino acid transport system substrate-binding protein
MARFAFGTLKVRRVAAFDEWPDTGSLVIASFKDEFTRLGGSLVLQRQVAQGSQDFSAFLTDAKSKGAQALYAVTGDSNEHACAAAAQAKSAFPEGVYFFGTDAIATDEGCIKDAVDNADGIVATFPDVDITQSNEAAARSVVKSYRQAYPTTSNIGLGIYVFAAYDCARLLIDAISRALQQNSGKIPTRLQVLNAVASTQGFEGVTGTYSFDARGDATSPLMSVYRVTNGAGTYL